MTLNGFERIEVLIRGGLGNQLFGFATGFSVSRKLGCPLHLLTSSYYEGSVEKRPFELAELLAEPDSWGPESQATEHFKEKSFRFDHRIASVVPNTVLDGYFQSEKYFTDHKRSISGSIASSADFSAGTTSFPGTPFIALHVRRGDYLQPDQLKFHGLTSFEYFELGLRKLRKQLGNLPAVVFSDSDETAEEFSSRLSDTTPHRLQERSSSFFTLGVLSKASGLCISNSSFGWWGAYLATEGTPVIAPTPWFRNRRVNTKDLLPRHWQKQRANPRLSWPGAATVG